MVPVASVPVARAEDLPLWTQLSAVREGWDSWQLSGHAAKKKRENTSMLKAFSSSTRLQPWFGESDPVTAHCGWGTSAPPLQELTLLR